MRSPEQHVPLRYTHPLHKEKVITLREGSEFHYTPVLRSNNYDERDFPILTLRHRFVFIY